MPQYKALALDLDGTLIGPDELIPPEAVRMVERAAERLSVSIVTGRETADVIRYSAELGLKSPQISDNGALILDPQTGAELWSAPLGPELSRRAMRPIIESGCAFFATHSGGAVTDLTDIGSTDFIRISALDLDEATANEMVAAMSAEDDLYIVKARLPYNGLWAVDFTRSGVNKGSALRVLCNMMDISPSQVIAIGDSFNDVPMLENSRHGHSHGRRLPPPNSAPSPTTPSPPVHQNGLAQAIQTHILPILD